MTGHTDTKLGKTEVHFLGRVYIATGPDHHKKAVKKLEELRREQIKKSTH